MVAKYKKVSLNKDWRMKLITFWEINLSSSSFSSDVFILRNFHQQEKQTSMFHIYGSETSLRINISLDNDEMNDQFISKKNFRQGCKIIWIKIYQWVFKFSVTMPFKKLAPPCKHQENWIKTSSLMHKFCSVRGK